MNDEEFVKLLQEAVWINEMEMQLMKKAIAKVLGGSEG
jgi:hypothetical protein